MIKNIIFDFGGILIHVDYRITLKAFSDLFDRNFTFDTLSDKQIRVFYDYEKGVINTETFIWNLQHDYGKHVQAYDIIKAWNAMLLPMPAENLNFLSEIKKDYNTFLMSNTNALHIEAVMKHIRDEHGINDFDHRFFTQTYYSHIMGLRKPDRKIFETILSVHQLETDETIFIDDIAENLIPAQKMGLHIYNHPRNASTNLIKEKLRTLQNK